MNFRYVQRRRRLTQYCWPILVCCLSVPSNAVGQGPGKQDKTNSATAELPAFEVASIRAVPANRAGYTSISPYGEARFTATNVTLTLLVSLAYGVDDRYIEGRPAGMDTALFDVAAKPEGDILLTYDTLRPLLQQLLQKRFALVVHRETKELAGYTLVVARKGPKLKTVQNSTATSYILPDGLRGTGLSMNSLAGMLSRPVHRPVIDRTQLTGSYDITLHYAPDDAADSSLPSIFTALEEQLGLKLIPAKVPVEMLVIDHMNKEPTEN